jgi:predicted small secreted protein
MSSRLCLLLVVACSALVAACDGTSQGSAADAAADASEPPADAFADATSPPPDVALDGPGAKADGAIDSSPDLPLLCRFDASIPAFPELPDAGPATGDGGAGDGGAGLATCLPCVATKCRDAINACLGDCACRVALVGFIQCLGSGMPVLPCAAALAGLPAPAGSLAQAPLICAYTACGKDCGLTPGS